MHAADELTHHGEVEEGVLCCLTVSAARLTTCSVQIPVERPSHLETTSLGAAFAAGIGVGFWSKDWVLNAKADKNSRGQKAGSSQSQVWEPQVDKDTNSSQYTKWKKAVKLSFGLADLAEPDQAPECQ